MYKVFSFILPVLISFPLLLPAQDKDSLKTIPKPFHKNVIKINPTPMLLWSKKNLTFSYERIVTPTQSFAVSLGYLEFPRLFNDSIAGILEITSRQKMGINISGEYRFYLASRNERPTPDGVYLAPYLSFYGYRFKNGIDVMHTNVDSGCVLNGNFYCFNLGIQLGYQFVFWKRFTLDLIFIGPSVSYYGGGIDISGQVDFEKLREVNEEVYNKIIGKYPLVSDYIFKKSFRSDGKLDIFSLGFRYVIQFGYHF
jgi:hypothetical protein